MNDVMIEVDGLAFSYPDGSVALRDVSLRVAHGESVAIVGANGAGKSTLLLHLTGSVAPRHGRVRIAGIEVSPRTLPEVRRAVGMVFQEPDDQLFMPTVHEDVAFGPLNLGCSPAEAEARVSAALARVGAASLRERAPYHLSGGEKRAVAIATVLAMEPAILALDEPSAGLDPGARRRLIELLGGLAQTRVIATHDLELALELCTRAVVLDHGRIAADGPAATVFADEQQLAASSLEVPASLRRCPACGESPGGMGVAAADFRSGGPGHEIP